MCVFLVFYASFLQIFQRLNNVYKQTRSVPGHRVGQQIKCRVTNILMASNAIFYKYNRKYYTLSARVT